MKPVFSESEWEKEEKNNTQYNYFSYFSRCEPIICCFNKTLYAFSYLHDVLCKFLCFKRQNTNKYYSFCFKKLKIYLRMPSTAHVIWLIIALLLFTNLAERRKKQTQIMPEYKVMNNNLGAYLAHVEIWCLKQTLGKLNKPPELHLT